MSNKYFCNSVFVIYRPSVESGATNTKLVKSREKSSTANSANASAKVNTIYSDEADAEDHKDNTGLEDG